jgi:transposase-like protein
MTKALTPEDREQILALYRGGAGRNVIARTIGCSPATVSKVCKAAGVHFDRNATAQAVAARQIDLKARRQAILHRIYTRVEKNLDRLETAGYTYSLVLPGGAEDTARIVEHTDDDPPSQDERNHMSVVTGYLQAAAKLEAVDSDGGATDAVSMLSRLAEELGIG